MPLAQQAKLFPMEKRQLPRMAQPPGSILQPILPNPAAKPPVKPSQTLSSTVKVYPAKSTQKNAPRLVSWQLTFVTRPIRGSPLVSGFPSILVRKRIDG